MDRTDEIDLEAYRARIGYEGEFAPTLAVLTALAERHVGAIPFENLDVLLGRGIDLELPALVQKLIYDRRGGYCFEQNGLMLAVLRQIGFAVVPLAGRVRIGLPRDVTPPRTHLFLSVQIDGEDWIFDAGVGGFSLTAPIRRDHRGRQETPHESRQIVEEDGKFYHQVWTGAEWTDAYEFRGDEMPEVDRALGNWWTSTNPTSKFSQNLFASRALPAGERCAILNRQFTRRRGPEALEEFTIEGGDHLLEVLAERFDLDFPPGTRFGSGDRPWPTV